MSPVKAKVLLVEDSNFTREKARESLEGKGHTVFEAMDFPGATKLLDGLEVPPDVALIDSTFKNGSGNLDDQAGSKLAEMVEQKFPTTLIVFYSDRAYQDFGTYRFPREGKNKITETEKIGPFVTQLPRQARK